MKRQTIYQNLNISMRKDSPRKTDTSSSRLSHSARTRRLAPLVILTLPTQMRLQDPYQTFRSQFYLRKNIDFSLTSATLEGLGLR